LAGGTLNVDDSVLDKPYRRAVEWVAKDQPYHSVVFLPEADAYDTFGTADFDRLRDHRDQGFENPEN
jgi:hypothetical protein